MQSTLKNMIIVLVAITTISSAAIGGVYILTKEPIAAAKLAKINTSIAQVMPPFDNNPSDEAIKATADGVEVNIYPAKTGDKVIGYAVESYTNDGFGGRISLLIGFTPTGEITKIVVLEHKETPGLGDKIETSKSNFSVQFEGVDPKIATLALRKDGGEVDAITASTITSRAYIDAVQRAHKTFMDMSAKQ